VHVPIVKKSSVDVFPRCREPNRSPTTFFKHSRNVHSTKRAGREITTLTEKSHPRLPPSGASPDFKRAINHWAGNPTD